MVQLNPGIYRLIVDNITPTAKTTLDDRIVQQDCLAKMSNVSKMLYEICSLKLYKDCLVKDLKVFLQDLETNPRKVELCGHISSLRVHQLSQYSEENAHSDLDLDDEDLRISFGSNTNSRDPYRSQLVWDMSLREWLEETAVELARAWKANETAFPNLVRLINTETQYDEDSSMVPQQRSIAIPRLLLNTPTVQHYCQDSSSDLFGFKGCILISNPPKIFTFHPRNMFDTGSMEFLHRLPVVMGSVNRYMFDTHVPVMSESRTAEDLEYDDVAKVLEAIYNMLPERPDYTDRLYDDEIRDLERNTTFEFYHCVRQIHGSRVWTSFSSDTAERSVLPSHLGRTQELLDMHLPPWKDQWEGRVFFKNAEECPPCSACGFPGDSAKWLGGRRV